MVSTVARSIAGRPNTANEIRGRKQGLVHLFEIKGRTNSGVRDTILLPNNGVRRLIPTVTPTSMPERIFAGNAVRLALPFSTTLSGVRMRIQFMVVAALAAATGSSFSAEAGATTRADAQAMPLGSWPAHLECLKDDNGNMTGAREEEIVVTDAPGEGNVLTRSFPDPTCHD